MPRQRTLQALIDWSWDLLDEDDRRLMRRLSVFTGGWTLDAAAAVTFGDAAGEAGARMATIDGLGRLVDRSLVVVDHATATHSPAAIGARVTDDLAPSVLALDPRRLAHLEADIVRAGIQGVVCGMCGIEPTVVGLAALRAMGVQRGVLLAAATSADAGGRGCARSVTWRSRSPAEPG